MPLGFDAISGTARDPVIRADATVTLAPPKRGLQASAVTDIIVALYLADIYVPLALYQRLCRLLDASAFTVWDILRLPVPAASRARETV